MAQCAVEVPYVQRRDEWDAGVNDWLKEIAAQEDVVVPPVPPAHTDRVAGVSPVQRLPLVPPMRHCLPPVRVPHLPHAPLVSPVPFMPRVPFTHAPPVPFMPRVPFIPRVPAAVASLLSCTFRTSVFVSLSPFFLSPFLLVSVGGTQRRRGDGRSVQWCAVTRTARRRHRRAMSQVCRTQSVSLSLAGV